MSSPTPSTPVPGTKDRRKGKETNMAQNNTSHNHYHYCCKFKQLWRCFRFFVLTCPHLQATPTSVSNFRQESGEYFLYPV